MKMKAFAFAMLLGGIAYSQIDVNTLPDSLRAVLSVAETDSARIAIYSAETWNVRFIDPELAVKYSVEAILMAEEAGLYVMQVDALTDLGYTYEVMGNGEKALEYYYKGYELANEISYVWGAIDGVTGSGTAYSLLGNPQMAIEMYSKAIYLCKDDTRPLLSTDVDYRTSNHYRPLLLADAYSNIGVVYVELTQFEIALDYYQKSLNLYPNDNKAKINAFINVGSVHLKLGSLDKAIEYFTQAKNVAASQADVTFEARSLGLIGSINRKLEKYLLALQNFEDALTKYRQLKNEREISKIHHEIGQVYFEMSDYQKSLEYNLLSLNYAKESEDVNTYVIALLGSGQCYILLSEFDKAESSLNELMQLSSKVKDRFIVRDAYLALSELFEKTGRYKKAFENQKKYLMLNDSLFTTERSEQIAEMEAKYETNQKQREIELLNAQNQINELKIGKQASQRNMLLITVTAFMVLVIILYNRYKIRTRANKRLQELDELKSRFFTDISHEFRTPLTLILGPIEDKLSEKMPENERERFSVIHRNAKRLLELINQLLDLSKLEAGQLKLSVRKEDFNGFLRKMISSFESLSEQRKIVLEKRIPEEPLEIFFDSDKCQKIVFNLLSNAFKFTEEGGRIALKVEKKERVVRVSLEDSGVGIPKNEVENIFQRFHQLQGAEHTQKGTGVGLALVQELVQLHRGKVEVSSVVGEGTTFTFELPLSSSAYKEEEILTGERDEVEDVVAFSASTSSMTDELMDQKSNKEYVLVVDDNQDIRSYVSQVLSTNYQILTATDGEQGLEKAIKYVPDLVISDWMMPKMDGVTFCKGLRSDERTSHVPIIMLTAKADQESKIEGLEIGVDDYLMKPFNEKELRTRVGNLIKQRIALRTRFSNTLKLEPSSLSITPPDETFLRKALKVVEENITNFDFTVEVFQREMAMSRMQLHRKLKALTNSSASEFIRSQRLIRAAQILEIKGVSVSETAYKCGFNNLSYFSKCFKEEFGVAPSEYPS